MHASGSAAGMHIIVLQFSLVVYLSSIWQCATVAQWQSNAGANSEPGSDIGMCEQGRLVAEALAAMPRLTQLPASENQGRAPPSSWGPQATTADKGRTASKPGSSALLACLHACLDGLEADNSYQV